MSSRSPTPTAHDGESLSFAQRNPLKDAQSAQKRAKKSFTQAEKITRAARTATTKARTLAFNEDVAAFHALREETVEELAKKHSFKPAYVRKALTHASSFKATREPSLQNALVHHKMLEVNQDRVPGNMAKLKEIQQLVAADQTLQNVSSEREEQLKEALRESRLLKSRGSRPSNKSAAMDAKAVLAGIVTELENLHERTGATSFVFVTRGHVQDTFMPGFADTGDAHRFFHDVLQMAPVDLATKFELWSCSKARAGAVVDSFQSMRSDATRLISEGLLRLLEPKKVTMKYIDYDVGIVLKHKVALLGWPSGVPFVNPSKLSTVGEVSKLRKALTSGECRWVAQSKKAQEAHAKEMKEKEAAGGLTKTRKTRSDKGKKRARTTGGKRARGDGDGDDEEEEELDEAPPTKKKKKSASHRAKEAASAASLKAAKAKLPPAYKSKEFVRDSDEEEEEEEEEEQSDG
ncbi:hypothetical protein FPV67DRAFT_1681830 [Lyophyllum atratum]|nr:hypothetical protein FPV67DRAFT_1681830 [Lyophyllum atratum]